MILDDRCEDCSTYKVIVTHRLFWAITPMRNESKTYRAFVLIISRFSMDSAAHFPLL